MYFCVNLIILLKKTFSIIFFLNKLLGSDLEIFDIPRTWIL